MTSNGLPVYAGRRETETVAEAVILLEESLITRAWKIESSP